MAYQNAPKGAARAQLDAALKAHHAGDIDAAVAAYRRILVTDPDNVDALNLLGTGLLQLGNPTEAVGCLERASRRQRDNPELLFNLAQCYMAMRRPEAAESALRKAIRIDSARLEFQLAIAGAIALQGRLAEAETLLRRLASRHPSSALVRFNLGNALRDQKRPEDAIAAYREALDLDPALVDARINLGSVLHSLLRVAEAETCYRECVAQAADHPLARFNLASAVMDLGRFEEAEALGRELLALAPQSPQALGLLAAALGHQGRLLEAREYHRLAARYAPEDPRAALSYGGTLMETGRFAEGLRWYARALQHDADTLAGRQTYATVLLAHGSLQEGWREYACRPAALRIREKYSELELTSTLPADLRGRHVLVLREQGLGDEIFFLRYAPRLAARGARISYRPAEKIASLIARIDCLAEVLDATSTLPRADARILVGDLPHALGALESSPLKAAPGTRCETISDFARRTSIFWPPVPPTLRFAPEASRTTALAAKLAALGPPPYIGVTWRGGTAPEEQTAAHWMLYKTVALPALGSALRGVSGTLVAIQRNPAAGELDALGRASGRSVHDLTALNEDLEGMLALLSLLDEYVTVSNTNVHLRATTGKPSRVLVPVPAEWRWMQCGRYSPWFPDCPVYRQGLQGDWGPALAALKRDLEMNYGVRETSNGSR